MKIQQSGNCYLLPLEEYSVQGFTFDGFPSLLLKPVDNDGAPVLCLALFGLFELTRYGQKQQHKAHLDVAAWQKLLELWQHSITSAYAYKSGELLVRFSCGTELSVPDAEFETWILHYESKNQERRTWVVGGVGNVAYFPMSR